MSGLQKVWKKIELKDKSKKKKIIYIIPIKFEKLL